MVVQTNLHSPWPLAQNEQHLRQQHLTLWRRSLFHWYSHRFQNTSSRIYLMLPGGSFLFFSWTHRHGGAFINPPCPATPPLPVLPRVPDAKKRRCATDERRCVSHGMEPQVRVPQRIRFRIASGVVGHWRVVFSSSTF